MSLNIKNEETVRLVRELADELHVSMTAAITDAVRARLEAVRVDRTAQEDAYVERVLAIAAEMRERLGDADLSKEIDDLYDEMGLPK
jgi:antitoxin VapB